VRKTRKTRSTYRRRRAGAKSSRSRLHRTRTKLRYSLANKRWDSSSPEQRSARVRSLEALRLLRGGKSLYASAKLLGISVKAVRQNLGKILYKRHRRWKARQTDRIERGLTIYEKGKLRNIIVNDSQVATLVGEHFNAVKKALISGDASPLEPYKKIIIRDNKRKKHRLETRLEKLKDIELGREDFELRGDIYAY
jgi:hypothetical protein